MVSVQEVLELAKKGGFDYCIIFYNKNDEIKLVMGLNGLTERINNVIVSYLKLLHYFNIPFKIEFYNTTTKQPIEFMDIPMYFVIEENGEIRTRQGGYM
jgi:hypothetical protein